MRKPKTHRESLWKCLELATQAQAKAQAASDLRHIDPPAARPAQSCNLVEVVIWHSRLEGISFHKNASRHTLTIDKPLVPHPINSVVDIASTLTYNVFASVELIHPEHVTSTDAASMQTLKPAESLQGQSFEVQANHCWLKLSQASASWIKLRQTPCKLALRSRNSCAPLPAFAVT